MIERLASSTDDLVSWIDSNRGDNGVADLSFLEWASSIIVLQGLRLNKVLIDKVEVLPNVVKSQIRDSEFRGVSTDSHFWGADNEWRECVFNQCDLKNVISPRNLFEDCRFENCTISGYRAFKTVFRRCHFVNSEFSNLIAEPNHNAEPSSTEKSEIRSSLEFMECSFTRTTFTHCRFRDVAFRHCTFRDAVVHSCSFDGVIADVEWWGEVKEADLFLAFLDETIREIRKQLGASSEALAALTRYRCEYVSGAVANKDYSACLYGGNVPASELDRVEQILDELELRHHL